MLVVAAAAIVAPRALRRAWRILTGRGRDAENGADGAPRDADAAVGGAPGGGEGSWPSDGEADDASSTAESSSPVRQPAREEKGPHAVERSPRSTLINPGDEVDEEESAEETLPSVYGGGPGPGGGG